jgi:hypothetical protein
MIPVWKNVVWDSAYKYLGIFIGPDAHRRRWSGVDRSLVNVASDIASVSSSWQHAGFLYSTYCISRLSYRLQFLPFDTRLRQLEARLIAKVTSTPMHVINSTVRRFMQHTAGKRVFPDLALLSEATLTRVWCKYDAAEELFRKYEGQQLDDDLLIIPPFPEWHASAIIRVLGDTHRRREHVGNNITLGRRGLQGCLLRAFCAHDFDPHAFPAWVAFSLRRLGISRCISEHIVRHIGVALAQLPLPIVAAYIKATVNGWTTSHRMGLAVGACPFCQSGSSDTLAHGLECAFVSGVVHQLLPMLALPPHEVVLVRMLGGIAMPQSSLLGLVIAIDCIHAAMMSARFGGSAGNGAQHAEARLRSTSLNHPRVRAVVLALR